METNHKKILNFLKKDGYKNKAKIVVTSVIEDAAEQLGISDEIDEDDILTIQEESWDYLGNKDFA